MKLYRIRTLYSQRIHICIKTTWVFNKLAKLFLKYINYEFNCNICRTFHDLITSKWWRKKNTTCNWYNNNVFMACTTEYRSRGMPYASITIHQIISQGLWLNEMFELLQKSTITNSLTWAFFNSPWAFIVMSDVTKTRWNMFPPGFSVLWILCT